MNEINMYLNLSKYVIDEKLKHILDQFQINKPKSLKLPYFMCLYVEFIKF